MALEEAMRTRQKQAAGVIGMVMLAALACVQFSIGVATPTPDIAFTLTPDSFPTLTLPASTSPPDGSPSDTPYFTPTEFVPTSTPPAGNTESSLLSMELSLDTSLATGIERYSSLNNEKFMWEYRFPEFAVYTLKGYPLQDNFHGASIYILRVGDREGLSEHEAGNFNKLEYILDEKPELGAYPVAGLDEPTHFLPPVLVINAAPMMHAQTAYLDFQNGSGVRYLTQFAQAVGPITNDELVYVFQGFTQDGEIYVVAIFPVNHPDLVGRPFSTSEGLFGPDNFEAYLEEVVGILDESESTGFTPQLGQLDALLQSLIVFQE